jgi:hypothetical protein
MTRAQKRVAVQSGKESLVMPNKRGMKRKWKYRRKLELLPK